MLNCSCRICSHESSWHCGAKFLKFQKSELLLFGGICACVRASLHYSSVIACPCILLSLSLLYVWLLLTVVCLALGLVPHPGLVHSPHLMVAPHNKDGGHLTPPGGSGSGFTPVSHQLEPPHHAPTPPRLSTPHTPSATPGISQHPQAASSPLSNGPQGNKITCQFRHSFCTAVVYVVSQTWASFSRVHWSIILP